MQKKTLVLPPPLQRVPASLYATVRAHMLVHDPDAQQILTWSLNDRTVPKTPDDLASEIVWIILCAGRSAQAARTLEAKVWKAIEAGKSAYEGFAYRKKAEAIDRAWRERASDFAAMHKAMASSDPLDLVRWARSIPYVGSITCWQLLKNLGRDSIKPDLWLCRLAGIPDRPGGMAEARFEACLALCQALSQASGDNVATVDSMLWSACQKGYLQVSAQAGPVSFNPSPAARRSYFVAAPDEAPSANSHPACTPESRGH